MTSTHELDARLAALAADQHGLVTRAQAAGLGVDRQAIACRLAAGLLVEPRPIVLQLPGDAGWPQAVLATVLAAGPDTVASFRSAARLHGLDGCEAEVLEVTSPRRLRLPGVVTHRAAPVSHADRYLVDGVPCTGLARTLADLGAVVPTDTVERAFDDARRRGVSVEWLRRTATRLHRPGQAGTKILLRLVEQAAGPPRGSWFEQLVERCLRSPRLPPIERQWTVRDARGRFVARLDLAMPSIRLGVEAHSRHFHFGPAAEAADERRDLRLAATGWVLYVGWHDLNDAERLLSVVEAAAAARGWRSAG